MRLPTPFTIILLTAGAVVQGPVGYVLFGVAAALELLVGAAG